MLETAKKHGNKNSIMEISVEVDFLEGWNKEIQVRCDLNPKREMT